MATTIDTSRLARKMARLAARLEAEVNRALDTVEEVANRSLDRTSGFRDRTGDLRASFRMYGDQYRNAGDYRTRVVGTSVYYAKFLEYGTRYISPRHFVSDAGELVRAYLPLAVEEAKRRALSGK